MTKQIHGLAVQIADKSAPEQRDEQIQALAIDLVNRLSHEMAGMKNRESFKESLLSCLGLLQSTISNTIIINALTIHK